MVSDTIKDIKCYSIPFWTLQFCLHWTMRFRVWHWAQIGSLAQHFMPQSASAKSEWPWTSAWRREGGRAECHATCMPLSPTWTYLSGATSMDGIWISSQAEISFGSAPMGHDVMLNHLLPWDIQKKVKLRQHFNSFANLIETGSKD